MKRVLLSLCAVFVVATVNPVFAGPKVSPEVLVLLDQSAEAKALFGRLGVKPGTKAQEALAKIQAENPEAYAKIMTQITGISNSLKTTTNKNALVGKFLTQTKMDEIVTSGKAGVLAVGTKARAAVVDAALVAGLTPKAAEAVAAAEARIGKNLVDDTSCMATSNEAKANLSVVVEGAANKANSVDEFGNEVVVGMQKELGVTKQEASMRACALGKGAGAQKAAATLNVDKPGCGVFSAEVTKVTCTR